MKTIQYKFVPINKRDRLELDDLYRRIEKKSPNKYQYTEYGKNKLIKFLSTKKMVYSVKRLETARLIANQLDGDFLNSAIVDCGELGTFEFIFTDGCWVSVLLSADKPEFDYRVEVLE